MEDGGVGVGGVIVFVVVVAHLSSVSPCPVMADARGIHEGLRRMGTMVSLVRLSFTLPLGCPFPFPLPFGTSFNFALAQTKSCLPCRGCPLPNVRRARLARGVSTDVVGFHTAVTDRCDDGALADRVLEEWEG